MSDRKWTDDMGEISGIGGSYERACRAMVFAGMDWCDEHPKANPLFRGAEGVFGIITEENEDARAMTKAIMGADVTMSDGRVARAGEEATGAMHHAAVQHVLAYLRLGWDGYCREMRRRWDAT